MDDEDEEDATPKGKVKGYSLVFDVVRRFAQPLGINLPKWEGRIIEIKKGVVRLLAVSERARQLFGKEGADAVADWTTNEPTKNVNLWLFPEMGGERTTGSRGSSSRGPALPGLYGNTRAWCFVGYPGKRPTPRR